MRLRLAISLALCLALAPLTLHAQKVDAWRTNADRTQLLTHQQLTKTTAPDPAATTIVVDDTKAMQPVEGFGFAMTGGSAELLHKMSPAARHKLLKELFASGKDDMGVSYLRLSIGASDMNDHVYTYDDLAPGETDATLAHFSLGEDEKDVIPVMKEVLGIAPHLHILASPWTAPAWMKTNDSFKGGTLKPEFYSTYANYLVRYLKAMQAHGITIDAITMQNEPLNPKNTPSLVFEADQEGTFLRDAFGPALEAAGLKTKVVLFDHNCNHPDYPIAILKDPKAAQYAAGSGFHLYEGEISALTEVHTAFPDKALYFTEQMVIEEIHDGKQRPVSDPEARVVIGAMRNWSRTVLLWNLAADEHLGPHTSNGGCPVCQGAITIEGDKVSRNIALYTIAHASKFVPAGSTRIASTEDDSTHPESALSNVAWRRPDGKHVLLVANNAKEPRPIKVEAGPHTFATTITAGETATFVW
jgi:glucosylceramidase